MIESCEHEQPPAGPAQLNSEEAKAPAAAADVQADDPHATATTVKPAASATARAAARAQLAPAPSGAERVRECSAGLSLDCGCDGLPAAAAAAASETRSHDLDTSATTAPAPVPYCAPAPDCGDSLSLESRSSASECATIVCAGPVPSSACSETTTTQLNVNGTSAGDYLRSCASTAQEQRQQQSAGPKEGEGCRRQALEATKVLLASSKGFVEEPNGGERVEREPADLDLGPSWEGSSWARVECGPRHCAKFKDVAAGRNVGGGGDGHDDGHGHADRENNESTGK